MIEIFLIVIIALLVAGFGIQFYLCSWISDMLLQSIKLTQLLTGDPNLKTPPTTAAEYFAERRSRATSVQINEPLEWKDVDEHGNEVVPRD